MGAPAFDTKKDPLAIEGLEDLLEQGSPQGGTNRKSDGTDAEVIDELGGPQDRPNPNVATAEEAAAILGISVRAVLKRLNKGTLRGRKTVTKFGEKWLVDREELPKTIHVEVSEQGGPEDGPENKEGGTEDRTGASQGGPQGGPIQNEIVLAQSLANQGELIATVLKQAEIIQELTKDLREKDDQIKLLSKENDDRTKLLSDSQRGVGFWSRFCSWLVGSKA